MPELILIEQLRAYLIAQGAVQAQSASPSTSVPSIWLDPREGAPEPRDGENVTVTLVDMMLAGPQGLDAWMEDTFVDVIIRARTKSPAVLAHRVIRNLICPINDHAGRKLWLMGDLLVERSTMWRPEQPVTFQQPELRTYTRTAGYRFECRRKALAGLPYAP